MIKLSTKIEKATAVKPAAKKTPAMPAAPKEAAKKIQQVLEKTENVEVTATGKVIKIPGDRSVSTALEEAGVKVPTSCEQGACGTCVARSTRRGGGGAWNHRSR